MSAQKKAFKLESSVSRKLRLLRSLKRKQLSKIGMLVGLILAQGAPIGLLIHLYLLYLYESGGGLTLYEHMSTSWTQHHSIFVYIWVGTSLYFSLFGWGLGKFIGVWLGDLQRSESSLALFSRFDDMNRRLKTDFKTQVKNPVASLLEFKEGLDLGFFGTFTEEQNKTIKEFLQDIVDIHNEVERNADPIGHFHTDLDFLRLMAKTYHSKIIFEGEGIRVNFEKGLLTAAISEILSELTQPKHRKLTIRVGRSPDSSQASEGQATVEFLGAKKSVYGPSWMIAGFILEWNGGQLLETQEGYVLRLPLVKRGTSTKGSAA